jgi:hypothetical protein
MQRKLEELKEQNSTTHEGIEKIQDVLEESVLKENFDDIKGGVGDVKKAALAIQDDIGLLSSQVNHIVESMDKHKRKAIPKKGKKEDPDPEPPSDDDEVIFIPEPEGYHIKDLSETSNQIPEHDLKNLLLNARNETQFVEGLLPYNLEFNSIVKITDDLDLSIFTAICKSGLIPQPLGLCCPFPGCKFNTKHGGKVGLYIISYHMREEHDLEYDQDIFTPFR